MSGPAPFSYPRKDKHNSNALPGLSYLFKMENKTAEVNLIHIFV